MDLNGIILRNNIHKFNDEFISMNSNNNNSSKNYDNSPDIRTELIRSNIIKAVSAATGHASNTTTPVTTQRSSSITSANISMNNSGNHSPKSRPLPTFFADNVQFSTKKERETPKLIDPPKPPIKSCPPISRLRPQFKADHDGARAVSFLNKKSQNDSDLLSKHYDENKKDLFFEQCFIIEGTLGCGSFGKVYKVKSKEDGKYYAIKKSKEKFKGHADRDRKLQEVAKHEELPPHPNFVKFYRAWEERQKLYIQIELCQMSLSTYAEKHHNIPEDVIWQFLIDLLQAVKHLHDRKLVHMDIKPDNIFISYDGLCKLGDFGLVVDLKKNDLREVQEGDPKYLAPEVLNNNNNITFAADIFSLGMTILELATDLDLPRGGDPWHQLRNNQIPHHLVSSLSQDLIEIIMRMIERDHTKRANVDELLNMPKIKKLISIKKRKLFYSNMINNLKYVYNHVYSFTVTFWCLLICPWIKLVKYVNIKKIDYNGENKNLNNNLSDENCQTSTPKKSSLNADANIAPLLLMNNDDDDDDHNYINENDSFNNISPYVDTSSSFSDHSEFSLTHRYCDGSRKNRTEPPLNKIHKQTNILKISHQYSPSSNGSITPPTSRTPPWKPISSLNSNDSTPIRHKLVFEDDKDRIIEDINNQEIRNKINFK